MVLWVAESGGSFVLSGFYLALFSIGGAVGGPLLARLADHRRQAVSLRFSGLVHATAMIFVALVNPSNVPVCAALVFLAGLSTPHISATMRSLWSSATRVGGERDSAYALESVLGEVFTIVGPLILSILLIAQNAALAIAVSGILAAIGAIGLASTGAISAIQRKEAPTGSSFFSPFRSEGFRALTFRRALEAVANGAADLAVPAFALTLGEPALTGAFFAGIGVGAIAGGIAFGMKTWSTSKETIYCLGLTVVAVGLLLPLLATGFWTMLIALTLGALFAAPVVATEYELISRTSIPEERTQAFAWMTTAGVAGSAIGAQAGGVLAEIAGYQGAFGLAAIVALLAAAFSWRLRPLWRTKPDNFSSSAKTSR